MCFVFIAFHDEIISWCTLKNHERPWWLLKQLWCIMNCYDVSYDVSLILKNFVNNHEKSWSIMICTITFQRCCVSVLTFQVLIRSQMAIKKKNVGWFLNQFVSTELMGTYDRTCPRSFKSQTSHFKIDQKWALWVAILIIDLAIEDHDESGFLPALKRLITFL